MRRGGGVARLADRPGLGDFAGVEVGLARFQAAGQRLALGHVHAPRVEKVGHRPAVLGGDLRHLVARDAQRAALGREGRTPGVELLGRWRGRA